MANGAFLCANKNKLNRPMFYNLYWWCIWECDTYLQILQLWLDSSNNESVSSNDPSMIASLLVPIPLLPDEWRSSDSNILISLMVNGSTLPLSDDGNDASVIEDAIVDVETGDVAALLNNSTEDILMFQIFFNVTSGFCFSLFLGSLDYRRWKRRHAHEIEFMVFRFFFFCFCREDNNIIITKYYTSPTMFLFLRAKNKNY